MVVTARAAVHLSSAHRALEIADIEVKEPSCGQVRVRMGASGVCGSDRHVLDGDWRMPSPTVLGHEGAGTVEAVGDGVTDLSVGDRVILSWFQPCQRCSTCREGRTWLCAQAASEQSLLPDGTTPLSQRGQSVYPYLAVGSMSEYCVVPAYAAVKIPDEVPFDVAALIGCSVATGVGSVLNDAQVEAGRSAVVIGAGGVGLCIVMGLALCGASPIIAADVNPESLGLARRFGATHVVRSDDVLPDRVREILEEGTDYAFEAIGRPETISMMPGCIRRGGEAVVVGLPPQDAPISINALALAEEGKKIIGSNYGGTVPARDFPLLCRLYLDGRLPVDELITQRVGLNQINEAFDAMRRGARGRSVLVFPDPR